MVKRIVFDLVFNMGSFAWLDCIRGALVKYLDIFIPLTWWTVTPAVVVVVAVNLMIDNWIEKGELKWR